ncbi:hypothetical protein A3841_08695 [Pontibacter flavimaris]|uniref:Glycoside hydrolase family 3 C-terminal domain-containing protein n=1 Tax=Pontibacter flavimaris TaxID=1797110 RepID=A0A1Q5PIM1_9BACT|nr:hypothetical protein A3841_08695 [Pontibacter flavimaris]
MILLWLKPSIRPLFPADDSPLRVNLSACAMDMKYVNTLTAKKPTVLVINHANPFAINEVYNGQIRTRFNGITATFGVDSKASLDVVSGKFNPTGKMPFTTPVRQQAVEKNKEGEGYALFKFGESSGYKQLQ